MTTRNLGFFGTLLTRFWHAETAARPCFLSHFCPGFVPPRQPQSRVFCRTFVAVLSRLLVRFPSPIGSAENINSPGHSPGLPVLRSRRLCGAFSVPLEGFTRGCAEIASTGRTGAIEGYCIAWTYKKSRRVVGATTAATVSAY